MADPVEITCGNTQTGKAVTFSISPLTRVIAFKTYSDGVLSTSHGFGPSHGIYDRSSLDFSGRNFLESDLYVHATYAQYLRINHFSAVTINLRKNYQENVYKLSGFSSGYVITSGSFDELKEIAHTDFIGLPCTIIGL